MSQLAYSAVGKNFVPATLSLGEPDNTARALCVELARVRTALSATARLLKARCR
jgi:hypothetical protein